VYHANMDDERSVRTKKDLELCTKIKTVLAADRTLTGKVVFGYITSIIPGTIRRPGNVVAIGSRLTWYAEALEPFS